MLKYIALNRNLIEDMNMLIYNFKVKILMEKKFLR
jgi:hypothetical protein